MSGPSESERGIQHELLSAQLNANTGITSVSNEGEPDTLT